MSPLEMRILRLVCDGEVGWRTDNLGGGEGGVKMRSLQGYMFIPGDYKRSSALCILRSASTDHFSISTSSSKIISTYDNMHLPSITAALALIGLSAATPTE